MRAVRRLGWIPLLAVVAAVLVGVVASGSKSAPTPVTAMIGARTAPAPPIPPGFVGFSFEYSALPAYAGTDPRAVNPVLERLLRGVTPGQRPLLRIGGDSTDRTWWPVPGMQRPGGVTFGLTPTWTSVARALARDLHARMILGVDMEAGSVRLARVMARQLARRVGASEIRALELGNEPELYANFPWFRRGRLLVRARPRTYSPADFEREFARTARVMPRLPLAGPASGQPRWSAAAPRMIETEPRLRLITLHRYATRGCFTSPASPQYHTIKNLLSPFAIRGLAATLSPYTRFRIPLRLDELGSVNCGGVHGVSDTFASALWSLDELLELASIGVQGVNFHTFPGARYQPFAFRRTSGAWTASVKPAYYGMFMFAQAARPGSRLLVGSGHAAPGLDVWSMRARDRGISTVLVNYGTRSQTVSLHLPSAGGPARIERLTGPDLAATSGVELGGRVFTDDGRLSGRPQTSQITGEDGIYGVNMPADSAALVTVGPS